MNQVKGNTRGWRVFYGAFVLAQSIKSFEIKSSNIHVMEFFLFVFLALTLQVLTGLQSLTFCVLVQGG